MSASLPTITAPRVCSKTPINVSPVADTLHPDDTRLVLYGIEDPIITLPRAVTISSDEAPRSRWAWVGDKVVDGIDDPRSYIRRKAEKLPPRSAFDLDPIVYLRPPLPTSALTSSHEWNPVASFTASRRSFASRRSSIFSLRAASTTKLFRNPSCLQTASRASTRSAGSFVASVRVFMECPFSCTNMFDRMLIKRGGLYHA